MVAFAHNVEKVEEIFTPADMFSGADTAMMTSVASAMMTSVASAMMTSVASAMMTSVASAAMTSVAQEEAAGQDQAARFSGVQTSLMTSVAAV